MRNYTERTKRYCQESISSLVKNQDFRASAINTKTQHLLNTVRSTRKIEAISPCIARTRSPSSLLF